MAEKYRVIGGTHWDRNPDWTGANRHDQDRIKCFKAGDTIESERPLDLIFLNKFEKVTHLSPPSPVSDSRKLLVSQLIEAGAWEESDRSWLETMPERGFTKLCAQGAPVAPKADQDAPKLTESTLGQDVTSSFQRAYDEGLKVFRTPGGKHQVTEGTTPNRPVNPTPLSSGKVDEWIERYLSERVSHG